MFDQKNLTQTLVLIENLRSNPKVESWDMDELNWMSFAIQNFEALMVMRENPVMAQLFESYRKEIKSIDYRLSHEKDLILNPAKKEEAIYLVVKKETYEKFLKQFEALDEDGVKNIEKRLKMFAAKLR